MAAVVDAVARLRAYVYFHVLIAARQKAEIWRYRSGRRDVPLRARRYEPGDVRQILRLFRLVFREDKSAIRWRWEFLENPFGKTNVAVLEGVRSSVVGHYGGILVRFRRLGDVIAAAQSVDVMIHPAFRGRMALERLVGAYIETSRRNGVKLLYGFNRGKVARSNRRFFGAGLVDVSEWCREVPQREVVSTAAEAEPEAITGEAFDGRVDALWARIADHYPYAAIRDSAYFNWRYSARSDRQYTRWQKTDPASGRLVVLAVFGASGAESLILELLSDPGDRDAIAAAFRASIAHGVRTGRRRVRVWLPPHGRLRECAQEAGFKPVDSGFQLNVLPLDDACDADALQEQFYYTLGDYDVC
jgi:hypothetical protein